MGFYIRGRFAEALLRRQLPIVPLPLGRDSAEFHAAIHDFKCGKRRLPGTTPAGETQHRRQQAMQQHAAIIDDISRKHRSEMEIRPHATKKTPSEELLEETDTNTVCESEIACQVRETYSARQKLCTLPLKRAFTV
jgi:hypothetical protein